ncbi:MAG: histidine kinase dimerization/phospho-acceptor domain-containing protein [bacterium]|nr:histidine kinase dimerization/phospho-acceptor domain-containing protein [bacterium]
MRPFLAHCLTLNHDINNPLTGVIGYTEYVLSEPEGLSKDQIALLQEVMKCGERIQRLVSALGDEKAALAKEIDVKALIESGSD